MFKTLLPLVKIGFGIGALRLGKPHLCSDKGRNDEMTFKMFEILLLLVKIKFWIMILNLKTLNLCLDKGRNDKTMWMARDDKGQYNNDKIMSITMG
jgi:hypothetical protein